MLKPQAIKHPFADNLTLSIYYPLWIMFSRVASSQLFKQYDLAYTNQGTHADPIIRMGSHLSAEVRRLTDRATFAFDFSQPHVWNSSIANIDVDLDGGTIESGSTASGIFTASFAPTTTYYVIRCTVTLANGKSFTGIRYCFVKLDDPDSAYAPFGLRYAARISGGDTQTIAGRELEISTGVDVPEDTFYPVPDVSHSLRCGLS